MNFPKIYQIFDLANQEHQVIEGELELHIKYINVYTLYDIESQIRSTHLVIT